MLVVIMIMLVTVSVMVMMVKSQNAFSLNNSSVGKILHPLLTTYN